MWCCWFERLPRILVSIGATFSLEVLHEFSLNHLKISVAAFLRHYGISLQYHRTFLGLAVVLHQLFEVGVIFRVCEIAF